MATTKKKTPPKKKSATKTVSKKSPPKKKVPAKKKAAPTKRKSRAPLGLPEKLRDAALRVLDDRKAENVVLIDLRNKSSIADYTLIASGKSGRQLAAIADYLGKAFTELGVKKIKIEGLPQGDWVLIDAGDILVHLFRPEVRRYYNIEGLWKPRGK